MLKKGRQKKRFNKAWKSMRSHLLAFYKSQDPEELHRMRVQVKKMNALLVYTQACSKKQKIRKHFRPVKDLFKQAGNIRSVHVNLTLMERHRLSNEEFKKEQQEILAIRIKRFYSKRKAYLKRIGKAHQRLSRDFYDIRDKPVSDICKRRLEKLDRFLSKRPVQTDKLHKRRKDIKVILYFHRALPEPLARKIRLNTAYLDQLQEKIGKWHDAVSAIGLLKTKGYTDRRSIQKLQAQKRRILRSINALSGNFGDKIIKKPASRKPGKPALHRKAIPGTLSPRGTSRSETARAACAPCTVPVRRKPRYESRNATWSRDGNAAGWHRVEPHVVPGSGISPRDHTKDRLRRQPQTRRTRGGANRGAERMTVPRYKVIHYNPRRFPC